MIIVLVDIKHSAVQFLVRGKKILIYLHCQSLMQSNFWYGSFHFQFFTPFGSLLDTNTAFFNFPIHLCTYMYLNLTLFNFQLYCRGKLKIVSRLKSNVSQFAIGWCPYAEIDQNFPFGYHTIFKNLHINNSFADMMQPKLAVIGNQTFHVLTITTVLATIKKFVLLRPYYPILFTRN